MFNTTYLAIALIAGLFLGLIMTFIMKLMMKSKYSSLDQEKKRITDEALKESEKIKKEAALEAKDIIVQAKSELDRDLHERKNDLNHLDRRLRQKEENLEKKSENLERRDREFSKRERELSQKENAARTRENELGALVHQQKAELEKISGMTADNAKVELLRRVEEESRFDAAKLLKRIEEETRERSDAEARRIVAGAMQRVPVGGVVDLACSLVTLPNDEMKGRIIGREGRNIRALEMATGIDLIVDDTPGAIILSGFDPLRREIAKVSIERLVEDGRIHPGRIEEVVQKVREEIDQNILQAGETAAFELGIVNLPEPLARLVGRMNFFVISGYNLLQHCRETAALTSGLAAEFEISGDTMKRAGLLHGIGLVDDGGSDTPPLILASEIAARHGESPAVVQTIRCLHPGEQEPTLDAIFLRIARKVSLSRPGMRRDNMEIWMQRMRDLERVAEGFPGVGKAYAMRSGKELRVIVETEKVSDADVIWLSKDIAAKIEQEINYPGQVRINVIREVRAVDYAK